MKVAHLVTLSLLALSVYAEIYLQFPPGSNNRLDDQGRDRNNGWRLFESSNNNRGGHNRGTGDFYFYEGSELSFHWTNGQGCADPINNCELIFQYSCGEHMRNGYWTEETQTWTIPFYPRELDQCRPYYEKMVRHSEWPVSNCTLDYRYGMHESWNDFADCSRRKRNKGLFVGPKLEDWKTSAVYTRQNPQGYRKGYECPEERDYYPYWQPSIWRDIAVLTTTPARCPAYQAESQNVKSRWVCVMKEEYHQYRYNRGWGWGEWGYVPVTKEECENPAPPYVTNDKKEPINIGKWTEVPSWNLDAPLCATPPWSRENELGNGIGGYENSFNWTIPAIVASLSEQLGDRCVLRVRYNITARDVTAWDSDSTVGAGLNSTHNSLTTDKDVPTEYPIWERFGLDRPAASFFPDRTQRSGHGYVFGNDPWVDIFGSYIPKYANGTSRAYLQVAVDLTNYGVTSQDRTHVLSFRRLPESLRGFKIHNLNVAGKRGNIVQTFPGHEYDFMPYELEMTKGDLVHIQWNGANTNPQNAGEGPQRTDRSNIVVLADPVFQEPGMAENAQSYAPNKIFGHFGRSFPRRFGSAADFNPADESNFLGLGREDLYRLAQSALFSGYFDLGLRQIPANSGVGTYYIMCTRNNNFTNRGQKGKVVVKEPNAAANESFVEANYTFGDVKLPWATLSFSYDPRRAGQQEIRLEDAGPSPYGTNWIKITPHYLSVPDGGSIQLNMDHTWYPFTYGRIYWTEKISGGHPAEVYTNSDMFFDTNGQGTAKAKIKLGGFYVVKNVPNGSAIGGLILAILFIGVATWYLRKRFNCRAKKTEAREGLISGQTSDAPAATSAAAAPVTTTS